MVCSNSHTCRACGRKVPAWTVHRCKRKEKREYAIRVDNLPHRDFSVLIGLLGVVTVILLISGWVLPDIKQESFCPDCIDVFPLLGTLAFIILIAIVEYFPIFCAKAKAEGRNEVLDAFESRHKSADGYYDECRKKKGFACGECEFLAQLRAQTKEAMKE